MAKIKITKKQALMLENLNKPKILKITESQYKAILEHEGLGEGAVIPQIANSFKGKEKQDYIKNVNSETKIKGVFKESEELWKEFVNELYGLHESGSSNYNKLIKLMEACGYVENRKFPKSKFGGDIKRLKEVILSGLHKLEECGSPYMAMEEIEESFDLSKDMKKNDLFKGFVEQWLMNNSNPSVQLQYDKGNYLLAWKLARNIGNVGKHTEPKIDTVTIPNSQVNEYDDNLPLGADYHPDAPWNQRDDSYRRKTIAKNPEFKLLANTGESAIFEKGGELYYFYYGNMDKDEFMDYADVPLIDMGQDEDGMADYDYGDWEVNDDAVSNYLNSNVKNLKVGYGYESYENGADFVKMDQLMKNDVLSTFKNNPDIIKILGNSVDEVTAMGGSGGVFGGDGVNPKSGGSTYPVAPLGYKAKEISEEQLEESGGGIGNSGEYATGGFPKSKFMGTADDESVGAPVNNGITHKQTMIPGGTFVKENAFNKTQWAGGEFVEFDDCTKLNNNKEAQKGGCSTGAIDNVVKTKKTSSNVNAPSLSKKQGE